MGKLHFHQYERAPDVPVRVEAERVRVLESEPTINQLIFGDPLPGRSALDWQKEREDMNTETATKKPAVSPVPSRGNGQHKVPAKKSAASEPAAWRKGPSELLEPVIDAMRALLAAEYRRGCDDTLRKIMEAAAPRNELTAKDLVDGELGRAGTLSVKEIHECEANQGGVISYGTIMQTLKRGKLKRYVSADGKWSLART